MPTEDSQSNEPLSVEQQLQQQKEQQRRQQEEMAARQFDQRLAKGASRSRNWCIVLALGCVALGMLLIATALYVFAFGSILTAMTFGALAFVAHTRLQETKQNPLRSLVPQVSKVFRKSQGFQKNPRLRTRDRGN